MPPLDRSLTSRIEAEVASASWPTVVVKNDGQTWELKYWPLHPVFAVGDKVTLAVDKADPSKAWLQDVGDFPLRYLALGGIAAILLIFVLAFLNSSSPDVAANEMPSFPVTLSEPRGKGIALVLFGVVFLGMAIYVNMHAEGNAFLRWFYQLAFAGFGALLVFGGYHMIGSKVTITERGIVDSSNALTISVEFDQVKALARRPIYGQKTGKSSAPPIIGWVVDLNAADGATLYTFSTDLTPQADYKRVSNYLFQRFPLDPKNDEGRR